MSNDNFWPSNAFLWALCVPLGTVDIGCILFVIKCLTRFAH